MKRNKFLIFSSSRAEYGLMENLILKMEKVFNISLAISGAHLKNEYGKTYIRNGDYCFCWDTSEYRLLFR